MFGLRRWIDAIWPLLAGCGVLALTQPWNGSIDLVGLAFGAVSGAALGGYVVFTQHVGDRFSGVEGIAIDLTVAALCTSPFGLVHAVPVLTPEILLGAAAAAILLPVLPYVLEMLALGRLTTASFGTLLSFEPAFATFIGFLLLHQTMTLLQITGIVCVVAASLGAVRRGDRSSTTTPPEKGIPPAPTPEGAAAD
ncbi:EamA family transporter [Streptomyces sp. NPDC003038]|uniref:EamA family transporter n=1 Tax=unclassified Streptomyces TaxID=2593676 RepID=UPI0033B60691